MADGMNERLKEGAFLHGGGGHRRKLKSDGRSHNQSKDHGSENDTGNSSQSLSSDEERHRMPNRKEAASGETADDSGLRCQRQRKEASSEELTSDDGHRRQQRQRELSSGEPAEISGNDIANVDDEQAAGRPIRLLLVSSRIKNSSVLQAAILPNATMLLYKYENASLASFLGNLQLRCYAI